MQQLGQEFAMQRQSGCSTGSWTGSTACHVRCWRLGTLGLFVTAMVDPLWFAERMQGIALVPEPLWWLLGVIVSFYFGARHQVKSQEFQREIVATVARVPQVVANIRAIRELRHDDCGVADTGPDASLQMASVQPDANPALEAWRKAQPDRPADVSPQRANVMRHFLRIHWRRRTPRL